MKAAKSMGSTSEANVPDLHRLRPTKIYNYKMLKETSIRNLRVRNPRWTRFATHPAFKLSKGHCKFLNKIRSIRFLEFEHYGYQIEHPEIDDYDEEEEEDEELDDHGNKAVKISKFHGEALHTGYLGMLLKREYGMKKAFIFCRNNKYEDFNLLKKYT